MTETTIAKCRGEACAIRARCARFTRPEQVRQTWLLIPAHAQNQSCLLYEADPVGEWVDGHWVISPTWESQQ